jgi:hypothetical protein
VATFRPSGILQKDLDCDALAVCPDGRRLVASRWPAALIHPRREKLHDESGETGRRRWSTCACGWRHAPEGNSIRPAALPRFPGRYGNGVWNGCGISATLPAEPYPEGLLPHEKPGIRNSGMPW